MQAIPVKSFAYGRIDLVLHSGLQGYRCYLLHSVCIPGWGNGGDGAYASYDFIVAGRPDAPIEEAMAKLQEGRFILETNQKPIAGKAFRDNSKKS